MIYGDTSFLIALYRQGDLFHKQAAVLVVQLQQPIALTLLCELELINGVHRCLAGKLLDQREHDAILRQISSDEADGTLVRQAIDHVDLFARARTLSKKYTPEVSARSLDILHVAASQLLKTSKFISFDAKQRVLAQKAGLDLLPRTISSKAS